MGLVLKKTQVINSQLTSDVSHTHIHTHTPAVTNSFLTPAERLCARRLHVPGSDAARGHIVTLSTGRKLEQIRDIWTMGPSFRDRRTDRHLCHAETGCEGVDRVHATQPAAAAELLLV